MSVQALSWVLDDVRGIKPTERLALISIANHADRHGRNAWPSYETIAAEADINVDTAKRAVRSLRSAGVVTVEINRGGDADTRPDRRPNRYALPLMGQPFDGRARNAPPPDAHGGDRHGDPVSSTGARIATSRGCESVANGGDENAPRTVHEPSNEPNPCGDAVAAGEPTSGVASFQDLTDALIVACYGHSTATLTDIELGRVRRAARSLAAPDIAASCDAVADGARRYRDLWPNAPLTPQALVGNWNLLQLAPDELIAAAELPEPAQRFDPDCECHGGWIFNALGAVEPCQCTAPRTEETQTR